MARKFFLVAAGMFLLALSYHFGAARAGAQSAIVTVGWTGYISGNTSLAVVGRTVYLKDEGFPVAALPPVPGSEPIVACGRATQGGPLVMLANGDTYLYPQGVGPWTLLWNATGNAQPVPTTRASWGEVKARYHAAPGMTVAPGADSR